MKIDTTLLRSMSVSQDEVEALELDPGDAIRCKGKTYYWDKPMVLMVDRLNRGENAWHTTMIRQALECPYGDLVTVPGGIPPITIEGTVAVPDFAMSGTSWYIIPEDIAAAFDLEVKRLGAA